MMHSFRDKVVVLTGASAGIGAAVARGFAREGARLALAARGEGALVALRDELASGGAEAVAIPTDVGDPAAAAALVEEAAARFGGIDVLVNNAGYNTRGPIERFEAADLAQVIQVNLVAPIVLTRLVLPHLRRRGGGAIVNVASLAGRVPVKHTACYSASKFGLRAFSFALREELADAGVTVSVVSPGPVDTGFIMSDIDAVSDLTFAQPMSTPEQIAELVLACARDGKAERMRPVVSGLLATLGYLSPGLRRLLSPLMEAQGRRAKAHYRARAARSGG